MASKAVKRVGFIGLGAMGFGMASHLLKSGFSVTAFDVGTYTYYSLHNLPFELLQIKYKK
jgi:3-hydroxyacyl-CoA dehydrogenase